MTKFEVMDALKELHHDVQKTGSTSSVAALMFAIDAVRELMKQDVPLTLEELRQMDGEPVWVTGPSPLWALVQVRRGGGVNIVSSDPAVASADGWMKHIGPIYRRKPEVSP